MAPSQREVLVFEVGGRCFGLAAADVREIVRAVAITSLPGGPPAVEGVINVRGDLLPVVDLRRRLGLPARAVALSDHLVIVRVERAALVVRVDRALELQAEERGDERRVIRRQDGLVPVLEPREFLAPEDWSALHAWLGHEGDA